MIGFTQENTMEPNKNRKYRNTAIITAMALLLLTYLGMTVFFTAHFYPNTYLNGLDISYRTPDELSAELKKFEENYILQITGRGQEAEITAKEISLQYQFDRPLDEIAENQNPFLWFLGFFRDDAYEAAHSAGYDEEAMDQILEQSPIFTEARKEPVNARIGEYSAEKKQYGLIPEEKGNILEKENVKEAVRAAITDRKTALDLEKADCYQEPEITVDNEQLVHALKLLNTYVSTQITYRVIGGVEELNGDVIQEWISIDQNKINLDEEAARAYVNSIAKKYDTYGKNRTILTSDGREKVLPSGAFGWRIDRPAETEELLGLVTQGAKSEREPVYAQEGYVKDSNDIGNTYVEIDMGNQHLYVYEEGNLIIESDFVSGNMVKGWATPEGVFGLTYKTRNATLKGENYATPVSYWMPFNGNIGMHDAGWRSGFGGEIYISGGSHGCINLPPAKAREIYEFVSKGMPVICYY